VRLARDLAASASTIPGQLPALTMTTLCLAELELGDPDAALATARRLVDVGPGPWPTACAAWLEGLVRDEPDLVRRGADGLAALDMPYQAARARLDWARLRGDPVVAAEC